jgi:small-conductance mechanosensitive channel
MGTSRLSRRAALPRSRSIPASGALLAAAAVLSTAAVAVTEAARAAKAAPAVAAASCSAGGMPWEDCDAAAAAAAAATTTIPPTTTTTLAGRIWPNVVRLASQASPQAAWGVYMAVRPHLHYQDLLAIFTFGWGSVPLGRALHRAVTALWTARTGSRGGGTATQSFRAYEETRFYAVLYHWAQAVQLSLLVYIVDVACLLYGAMTSSGTTGTGTPAFDHHLHLLHLHHLHPDQGPPSSIDVSLCFAKVVYTLWLARVCAKFKHYLLAKYVPKRLDWRNHDNDPTNDINNMDGLVNLIDHLFNAIIGGVAAMVIIDILELSGLGVRSAFALGSAGTLAVTLGTQSLVGHIVSGFTMTTSNRFYVGDYVQLSKGGTGQVTFAGTVESLGWLETTIRGSNDQVTTIPNSQLEGIQVCNLSRNTMCQVRQVLRFRYRDAAILPTLLPAIRDEIIASCPKTVTDGRRPCRVVWTDYCDSHLEVVVDVHFDGIKPIGDAYWSNRQEVLLAIHRAVVDKHGISFAVMESTCRTQLQQ